MFFAASWQIINFTRGANCRSYSVISITETRRGVGACLTAVLQRLRPETTASRGHDDEGVCCIIRV